MNRNGRRCALGVTLVVFLGYVTAGAQVQDFEPVTAVTHRSPMRAGVAGGSMSTWPELTGIGR